MGSFGGSDGEESAHNVRDLDSIPGLGRFRREGNDNLLQYSWLVNPMDWQATACSVTNIRTQLSDLHNLTIYSYGPNYVSLKFICWSPNYSMSVRGFARRGRKISALSQPCENIPKRRLYIVTTELVTNHYLGSGLATVTKCRANAGQSSVMLHSL